MSKWEDEDDTEGPAERAWKRAEDEGAKRGDAERRRRLEIDAAEAGVPGRANCPAGALYIHRRGEFCPACGATS